MRQHGWARKARTLAIGGGAVLGVAVAGLATTMSASAHYIIGTTPQPSVGVVGKTALADQAVVYADSSRHVTFFLWAPGTCGVQGAHPVFTDSEPVTTASLTDSTVTSGTFVPQSTGTFEWTAEIVITSVGTIESGPTACGDEPVTVNKVPTSIDTTPSTSHGTHVGSSLSDSATVDGFNATGNIRFYLFGPDNPTCNFNQTTANEPHGWIFMAGPVALVNDEASVPPPGFIATQAGVYQWVADYGGDANNTEALGGCGKEPVTIGKMPTSITSEPSSAHGAPVGTALTDSATVIGSHPTGNMRFYLFGPGNPTCQMKLPADGGTVRGWIFMAGPFALVDGMARVPAPGYTTTEPGVYQWVVDYGGDANNTEALSVCGKEAVTIGKHSTALNSTPSAGGVAGTVIWDTVRVTDGLDPSGTVTFSLYSPSDSSCSGPAIFSSTVALLADGSAKSASFSGTKTAGTYEWIAVYNGNANNAGSNDKCGDEPVHITAVSSGVQGITTPGTGVGFPAAPAIGLLLGGLGVTGIASAEIRRMRRLG
ncbi:MAG: hypothetical protein WB808_04510 [Candidatus Dormiibacterota bacterium]